MNNNFPTNTKYNPMGIGYFKYYKQSKNLIPIYGIDLINNQILIKENNTNEFSWYQISDLHITLYKSSIN